ncbi:hypothetical protein CsatB_013481 [Cannabis sativa]
MAKNHHFHKKTKKGERADSFSILQSTNPEFLKKIMARSNSTSSDFDKDNFRKPIAIPFKWESQPGIPKIPSTPPFSKYDYLDDDNDDDNDDDRNIKEENGLSLSLSSINDQSFSLPLSRNNNVVNGNSNSNKNSNNNLISSSSDVAILKTSSKYQTIPRGCIRGLL